MLLAVDKEFLTVFNSATVRTPATKQSLTRRNIRRIGFQFVRATVVQLAEGSTGQLLLKPKNDPTAQSYARALAWTREGDGINSVYWFELSLITDEVEALFEVEEGLEPSVISDLILELNFIEDGRPQTPIKIPVELHNRWLQEDEDVPQPADPDMPDAANILVKTAQTLTGPEKTQVRTNIAAVGTGEKGAANGVASLDAGGKVPPAQLPDSVLGQVSYKGAWEADTNTPDLTALDPAAEVGDYYVVNAAGDSTFDPDGAGRDFAVGDWLVFNGATWDKVDNTEPIADEATAGISRRATTEEAETGEDDSAHMTPAKASAFLAVRLASASQANQMRDATLIVSPANLRSQTTANVSATLTLIAGSDIRQVLAPQTADRDVVLPVINATPSGDQVGYGHTYEIVHDGAANSLLVKNSGGTLQARLDTGESGAFIATSSGWLVVKTARYGVTSVIYPSIDLTAAIGNTTMFTPVAGTRFHAVSAFVRNDLVSGIVSTPAQIQIDNGTDGQDLFSSATLTSPATGRMFALALATQPWLVDSTNPLRLRRTVAAAGTTPAHTGSVIVNGVLA